MSADFTTEHFKAFLHHDRFAAPEAREARAWVHVVHRREDSGPLGDFSLADIAELAEIAGRAWPDRDGVEVQYVIEARERADGPWTVKWSSPAGSSGGSEEFAEVALGRFARTGGALEWRLVRHTLVISDEVITSAGPDGAHLDAYLGEPGLREA